MFNDEDYGAPALDTERARSTVRAVSSGFEEHA